MNRILPRASTCSIKGYFTAGAIVVLTGLWLAFGASVQAASNFYYVVSSNPLSAAPYTNWAMAATNIQDALNLASSNDYTMVSSGVYRLSAPLVVTNNVYLGGVGGRPVLQGAGSNRVLMVDGGFVDRFEISGGYASLADGPGGGLAVSNGFIMRSVISGNTSADTGGGAAVYVGGALLNCLVVSNTAHYCGGVYVSDGMVMDCTIVANAAIVSGIGGIGGNPGDIGFAYNSIIYGNAGGLLGTNYDAVRNNVQFNSCSTVPLPVAGTANIAVDPRFVDPNGGDYHLQTNSPCIDAGNTNFMAGPTDLDGHPRLQGASVDLGAYEWGTGGGVPTVDNNGGASNVSATAALLTGNLVSDGGADTTVRIYWGPADGGANEAAWASVLDLGVRTVGPFSAPVSNLTAGTTYSYRCSAGNAAGTAWAPASVGFTTAVTDDPPTNTHYVSTNGASVWPYVTWGTAANTIQDAVDAATAGDVVMVNDGVYGNGGKAVFGSMTNRVAVDKAITVRSVNGAGATHIAGRGNSSDGLYPGDGAVRCVYLASGATLAGFTLMNGCTLAGVSDYTLEQSGGGVWCASTNDAIVTNCVLVNNTAEYVGGGAYGGLLLDCQVVNNSSYSYGGGVAYSVASACSLATNWADFGGGGAYGSTLLDCGILDNAANYGGGVYDGTLSNCTLVGNAATLVLGYGGDGGGAKYGTLYDCQLSGNRAEGYGGGAYACTLQRCWFDMNDAMLDGGGAYLGTLDACTLMLNSASRGGGVGEATLYNCLLYSNAATNWGGGAYNGQLFNCTLALNSAAEGGGIYADAFVEIPMQLQNCIVYSNAAAVGANWSGGAFYNSCTEPMPTNGAGNIVSDPLFIAPGAENFRLRGASPCINAGVNDVWMDRDLDGNPRILRGTVDMGAYEYAFAPGVIGAVAPSRGPTGGGTQVTITGSDLGSGTDITSVTLCGVAVASIVSQSGTQVVVVAGSAAGPVLGDVVVYSTVRGVTVASNAYAYFEPVGQIQCFLLPGSASGAQWRVTSGPDTNWHSTGQVSGAAPTSGAPYAVTFSTLSGWVTPADITGIVPVANGTATVTAVYVPQAMALIPGTTFLMGQYQGQGGHVVTLSRFYLDRRPVTVGEFQAFCADTGAAMPSPPAWGWTNASLPMVNVTWSEAAAYAAWAGKRLPTEAEYECAMRDTLANKLYPWGDAIGPANANYLNLWGRPTTAGTYAATANYGLWDIAGNVWEWCNDWYADVLTGPVTNPAGPASGTIKTVRGGSWVNSEVKLRCAGRYQMQPGVRYADLGFRCAMDIKGAGVPAGGGDPNRDSDGDGVPDALEYLAGTDPNDASSWLGIESVRATGAGMWVGWKGGMTATQYLEATETLSEGNWRVLFTNVPPTATTTNFVDSAATNRTLFYRIKAGR